MNRPIVRILISIFLLLSALSGCYKKTETTEVVPSQLELNWEQSIDPGSTQQIQTDIAPDLTQQLKQIGDYRFSSLVTYAKQTAKVEFKLVFLNEVKTDSMHILLPQLKAIFKEKPFKVIFHGRQETHVIRESYGSFAHTETKTLGSQLVATDTISSQAPSQK